VELLTVLFFVKSGWLFGGLAMVVAVMLLDADSTRPCSPPVVEQRPHPQR
jgi:hypothetical protein